MCITFNNIIFNIKKSHQTKPKSKKETFSSQKKKIKLSKDKQASNKEKRTPYKI